MAKILLDYVMPISQILPTPAASTAFLKQVCLVCKPKSGQEGNVGQIFECTTMTGGSSPVAGRTDNTDAQQLFTAGMNKVFILLATDLDLVEPLAENEGEFFTLLVSSDFSDEEIETGEQVTTAEVKASAKVQDILYTAKLDGTDGNAITISYIEDQADGDEAIVDVTSNAIVVDIDAAATTAATIAAEIAGDEDANALVSVVVDEGDETDIQAVTGSPVSLEGGVDEVTDDGDGLDVGAFPGVVGLSFEDAELAEDFAATENRCAFITNSEARGENMCFAFGKLLSNQVNWLNQQYITMPNADGAETKGEAESFFADKVSFVIDDDEFSKRLALFAVGGRAIVAPYILKNLQVDLQSAALNWISGNQPQYTLKWASLLESRLQEDVVDSYIARGWIEAGTVSVTLVEDNFVASGSINVAEPKALWRVPTELRQTL